MNIIFLAHKHIIQYVDQDFAGAVIFVYGDMYVYRAHVWYCYNIHFISQS